MATANQSRRDGAPRDASSRSALATFISFSETLGVVFDDMHLARFAHRRSNIGPSVEDSLRASWVKSYHQPMYILPDTRTDLLLLAAHTMVMSEQLERFHGDNDEDDQLLTGIEFALQSITAFLGRELGANAIDDASIELGRSVRIAINIDDERRADGLALDQEGR